MPNGEQQRAMRRFAGSCRFVFNKALALQQANRQAGEKFIGYVAMAKRLTEWRNGRETPWLKDAPVHPLQHALKDLDRAYKNFFAKRANFPRSSVLRICKSGTCPGLRRGQTNGPASG